MEEKQTVITEEELKNEVDYFRAQKTLEMLLKKSLISQTEFNKITLLNRLTFNPFCAKIMPQTTCYNPRLELTYHTDKESD